MKDEKDVIIGSLQIRVMHFVWKKGPSTVHEVHDALNAEAGAKKLAYTTILTVMRNLAKREMLSQKAAGRSHIFEPLIDEKTYKVLLLQRIRKDFFCGDVKSLLAILAEDKEISPAKRKAIAGV